MPEDPSSMSDQETLFPVPPLPGADTRPDVESSAFERKYSQLERDSIQSHYIRRWAAYGA